MPEKRTMPQVEAKLRKHFLKIPPAIRECSGILVLGKRIKSLVFTTDLSIIRNVDADAVLAVYPFTPQPIITQALALAADIPLFVGVGGGLTQGRRVAFLAMDAEAQGALGVVLNAPTANDSLREVSDMLNIPTVITVVSDQDDVLSRVEAGAGILNVAAGGDTPRLVRAIRQRLPDFPIIATGGPTEECIRQTIEAGANAISWTPPPSSQLFKPSMDAYRQGKPHP